MVANGFNFASEKKLDPVSSLTNVSGHVLVEKTFIHSKTHLSFQLVDYFKIHVVCFVLFNVHRNLMNTYVHKKAE